MPTYGSVLLPESPVVSLAGRPLSTSGARAITDEAAARDATPLPPIQRVAQLHSVSNRRMGYTIITGIVVVASVVSTCACARIIRDTSKRDSGAHAGDRGNTEMSARSVHIASTPDLRDTYGSALPAGGWRPQSVQQQGVQQASFPAAVGVFNFDDDGAALFGATESGV